MEKYPPEIWDEINGTFIDLLRYNTVNNNKGKIDGFYLKNKPASDLE